MKKFFSMMLALMMVLSLTTIAWGEEGGNPPVDSPDDVIVASTGNVAKVGATEYATIDEAIAAWTNNSTLTLLADVTLSDVITLKSTEHHTLDLGTYTMTAAAGKNAFVIKACGTGDAERSAITIKADSTNPGGINAGNKCIVYYKYADGGISTEDRPIIKIEGGVFTGSTASLGTPGIYTIGSAARKCATLNISGGTFNCSINGSGKSKLIISGGTFNYSVGSQGDSTALRLISGGTFKTFGFMTADSNNTKFWFGTSMGNSNVGVYVDENGYLVVGGPVITEAGDTFKAWSANYSGCSTLLQYSSASTKGLYYTSVKEALADNNKTTGSVTVYVDELDMTGISYKGTIVVPEGKTLTITNAPAGLKTEGKAIVPYAVSFDKNGGDGPVPELPATVAGVTFNLPGVGDLAKDGYTFSGWSDGTDTYQAGTSYTMPANAVTFTAQWTPVYTVTFNVKGHGTVPDAQPVESGKTASEPTAPTADGYTFGGWYTDADCTTAFDFNTAITSATTLYAKWTADTYTVKLDTNGGTIVDEKNVTSYTYGTSVTLPVADDMTKTGYTFAGWYDNEQFSGDAVSEIPDDATDNKTYYAKWTANTYTVAFDANSGDGTMADMSFTYGTAQNLTANAFTRVGYNFAGWATSADGAVAYANGASVSNLTAENNGTVTLYAVWTKIPPAPVYPSVDTPAFDPDEAVDVEDNTLHDAALAVGDAIENGDVKMEPAAGYTVEEIAKLQNEGKLNLVIQKKLSYDTTEKSLIDAAITKVGGSASQVDVVYIDVTPVLMTDDGMVVATITDTEKPLTITLDLSAEMQKAAKEGKFISVIRVHDGKITFLDSKLNAEKTKITFTSSEFSTYAVVAIDKDPSANTFDAGIAMYGVMALLAATGSAVIIKKRK